MDTPRIYVDNAATSFPKPPGVMEAMQHYAARIGASAGRGGYHEALEAGEMIDEVRAKVARLINAPSGKSIIFTHNCTDALTLAIKGLITDPDAHVITTAMDHNSVLRPLEALKQQLSITVTHIPADGQGLVDPAAIEKAMTAQTRLIAAVHASNVCGSLQDIQAIASIAQARGVPLLIDGAQTVGHVPIDVQSLGVELLAFPGHKGLLGPLGTGVLYIQPGFEQHLRPVREGGTGSKSELPIQPDFLPDRFESGSHNAIGIAGLGAGADYLLQQGIAKIHEHARQLSRTFLDALQDDLQGGPLTLYGPRNLEHRVGVFSVRIEGLEPAELSAILEEQHGLLTRSGLHCAPYAHKALGTLELGGTTRLSIGPFNEIQDLIRAASALTRISHSLVK